MSAGQSRSAHARQLLAALVLHNRMYQYVHKLAHDAKQLHAYTCPPVRQGQRPQPLARHVHGRVAPGRISKETAVINSVKG